MGEQEPKSYGVFINDNGNEREAFSPAEVVTFRSRGWREKTKPAKASTKDAPAGDSK